MAVPGSYYAAVTRLVYRGSHSISGCDCIGEWPEEILKAGLVGATVGNETDCLHVLGDDIWGGRTSICLPKDAFLTCQDAD